MPRIDMVLLWMWTPPHQKVIETFWRSNYTCLPVH